MKRDKKPLKQSPRMFMPEIMLKTKVKIERLLQNRFIRPTRHVEWLANIVSIIKKNGTLRVCIEFRDLNAAISKDEHPTPMAEILVYSVAGFEYLSLLDGYSCYNENFFP